MSNTNWEKQGLLQAKASCKEAEAKRLIAKADHLREMKSLKPEHLDLVTKINTPPVALIERAYVWITLWLAMVGVWSFLMMTFKKDVWPR